jgi:hypothetical protein
VIRFAVAALLALTAAGASAPANVDVSHASGPQNEVSAAFDPRDPQVLLAGSNSFGEGRTRAYGSTDGGASWTSAQAPPLPAGYTGQVDPSVGIDARGREYFSFLSFAPSRVGLLFVSTRPGAHGRWSVPRKVDPAVAGLAPYATDDKDVLAVAADGRRVYLAWSRYLSWTRPARVRNSVMISHSDDGGRTWSRPLAVATTTAREPLFFATVAVAASGTVYVGWQSGFQSHERRVFVARSNDGGLHFATARPVGGTACRRGTWKLRAQPSVEAQPAPTVLVAGGRVLVVHANLTCNGAVDVVLAEFDPSLGHRLLDRRVNPPDGRVPSEQFMPAAAYDPRSRELWVCWYDTGGDPRNVRTHFTCTVSRDRGRNFAAPRAVATAASDEASPAAAHGYSGREYGDYESVVAAGGVAHAFWTDSRRLSTLGEEIYTARLEPWR